MATFGFGSTETPQQLQTNEGMYNTTDGANFYPGEANPIKNFNDVYAIETVIRPIPIFRGKVGIVDFISTTLPPGATNVIILGFSITPI